MIVPWENQCWFCKKRGTKDNLCPGILKYIDDFYNNKRPYKECDECEKDEEFEREYNALPW
jgi:hypothetical protein